MSKPMEWDATPKRRNWDLEGGDARVDVDKLRAEDVEKLMAEASELRAHADENDRRIYEGLVSQIRDLCEVLRKCGWDNDFTHMDFEHRGQPMVREAPSGTQSALSTPREASTRTLKNT